MMPNSDLKVLGEKVRKERKLAGLTQEQLAERCHVSTKHMKIIQLLLVILQQKYRKVLQVQKDLMWKGRMFHFPILKQPAC